MADNVDKKIEKIEKNCYELAKKEEKQLKEQLDFEADKEVSLKLEDYKKELAVKYDNEVNKIIRQYNRDSFDFEMEEKIKINEFKDTLLQNIYSKVIFELQKFSDSEEYKSYLFKNIKDLLDDLKNNCKIYLTEKDYNKFGQEIEKEFNSNIEKISNDNIGGCIVVNEIQKISIDNTLKTNIQEKIKKISL